MGAPAVDLDDGRGMDPGHRNSVGDDGDGLFRMSDFPIEDPQFWIVTLLSISAVILLLWSRNSSKKSDQGGSCGGCKPK